MKVIKFLTGSIIMAAFFASCSDTPSYPSGSEVTAGEISCTIDGTTVTLEPVDADLPSSFMRGFDASAESDVSSGSYYDASGNEKDIFQILPSYGVNWVRLRIWNNPESSKNPSEPGASDLETVIAQAVRVKKAGLRLLLDFHYSDYWADPGKQLIPEEWLSCTTSDELAVKVSEYTTEVLEALKNVNAAPDMIQIGNEISSGMLKHKAMDSSESVTNADDAVRGDFCSANYFKYLSAGLAAARSECPNAKLMLHFTDINRSNPVNYLSSFSSLDYDVVGLSYYPKWASHGTIESLGEKIAAIKSTYAKEVVVVETNIPNKVSDTASQNYYENMSDSSVKVNLTCSDGNLYSGVYADSDGKLPATAQNQANIIRAVIEVAAKNGASGVFTWGGEYKGSWEYGLFGSSGKPSAALIVMSVQ
ncbi:MAG: glycosyl hydrolase 53 family protein [Treponema sp.]|nr:glycosyl hydrolase 53 family protein [Treponema sp.]